MKKQIKTERELNAVKIVKNKLWTFGYRVKDYSNLEAVNFDLLVEEKIKVVVGLHAIEELPKNCDVYAGVNDKGLVAMFTTKLPRPPKDSLVNFTSPYDAFGRPGDKK